MAAMGMTYCISSYFMLYIRSCFLCHVEQALNTRAPMAQKIMLHSENRIIRQHLSNVCPYMIYVYYSMTFDPSNALHSGQGFFPPNLVAIGHF